MVAEEEEIEAKNQSDDGSKDNENNSNGLFHSANMIMGIWYFLPSLAISFPFLVAILAGSGIIPTLAKSKRSASKQASIVGFSSLICNSMKSTSFF